jgi:hypothetical protein
VHKKHSSFNYSEITSCQDAHHSDEEDQDSGEEDRGSEWADHAERFHRQNNGDDDDDDDEILP